MTAPTVPYSDLPPEARELLNDIIDAWIDKTDARELLNDIILLGRGVAKVIYHGDPGADGAMYSIRVDPAYLKDGTEQ